LEGGGARIAAPERGTMHAGLKVIDKSAGQKAQQGGVRRGETSTRPITRRQLL